MKMDNRFQGLTTLCELSTKLVGTNKHEYYSLVYLVLKLALILPVAITIVERVFSALCLVKNKVRNSISDRLLNNCLVTFIECDIYSSVSEDDIIHAFMAMKSTN